MRYVLGVDPGPVVGGVVLLDLAGRCIRYAGRRDPMPEILHLIAHTAADHVCIERVQSCGISGASLLETSEVVGRCQQVAIWLGIPYSLLYRRDIIRTLDVTGPGNRDARVRQALIQIYASYHGISSAAVVGSKAHPGPLYGVAVHAWAALAVATTWAVEHDWTVPARQRADICGVCGNRRGAD